MKMVKLTDVCDFQGGTQPPKSEWINDKRDGFIRMLQIRDFTQQHKDFTEYVKDKPTLKKCEEQDILIGRYGASIGKICKGLEGAYNVALIKTIPNKLLLDNTFLFYLLKGEKFQTFIQSIGSRAAQAGFNKEDLSNFQIPLPPLETQQKIASILDAADTLRQKDKALLAKYDELTQALFLDMFGDPVSNPKGWDEKTLKDIVINEKNAIVDGPFGASIKQADYVDIGIPIIRINNIRNKGFYNNEFKYINKNKYKELSRSKVVFEDILLARVGNTIGKACIFDQNFEALLSTTGVAKISVDQNRYSLLFIIKMMSLKKYKEYINSFVKGAGQPYLNLTQIKAFKVLDVPIPLQAQFAERVTIIEKQKAISQASLEKSEELFNSLLQKAFKGDLV